MKQLLKFGLIFTIATSGLLFSACGDGDPGPTGAQGAKGNKGDKGDVGDDGDGFNELTQYGNIVVRYKGIDINDNAFDQTIDFKYCPEGPDAAWASGIWPYDGEAGAGAEFSVYRYNSPAISEGYETNNYAGFSFNKLNDDGEFTIGTYNRVAIVSAGATTFTLYLSAGFDASETVSDYSFNTATNELKFKFHVAIPAGDNSTSHALDISADVNVRVFENIDSPK